MFDIKNVYIYNIFIVKNYRIRVIEENIMRIKKGFTLAEILIVLMVIGVIATMTIPSLMKGVAEAQYKAGYKKAYNAIVNLAAMERISGQLPTKPDASQANTFFVAMANSLSVKEFISSATTSTHDTQHIDSGVVALPGDGKASAKLSDDQIVGLSSAAATNQASSIAATSANNTAWIVTDDGLAYTILIGSGEAANDCGLKADITSADTAEAAIAKSCLVIVVDVNGLYKGPNRLEIQNTSGGTTGTAADTIASATTKMATLTRDQYYIYVGSDGATAGPVGTTVSGRVVADLK